jgi:chromosome segregation protein
VPPRPLLSDEDEQAERDERARLRTLDAKLSALFRRRQELIAEMRQLSGEQKALYDRRQAPQVEVEELYHQHGQIGHRVVELRKARDAARGVFQEAVVQLRELKLSFAPGERVHPDQIRREIAELELRQQTRALPLDEENALIARLRQRTQELKEAEARAGVVAEHLRAFKEAEARVSAARVEVDRLGQEMVKAKADRDAKMAEVRSKLEVAGGLVAELRAKGRARAEVMGQIDAVSREMSDLEREGREILEHSRARRDEARKTLRTYTRRGRTPEELLASTAEAQLEELLKRGKVTLGG